MKHLNHKWMGCNFGYQHPKYGSLSLILVDVLVMDDSVAWDDCSHCGRPLSKKIYVFVTEKDNIEYIFGSECVKNVFGAGIV